MTYMPKELQKVVGTRPIRPDGVDKVTGRANFGADMVMPGMLWGKVKRSPHAHARIMSINVDKALKLPGVKAIVTSDDFPPIASEEAFVGEGPMNFRDLSRNCLARDKVLYDGHAVAAVAAISPAIAEEACELLEVEYHVLPYVIDVEEAMKPNAPLLHDDLFTQGVEPKPNHPSNIAKVVAFTKGDIDAGFRDADVIIERRYSNAPVHQAYIEPHACVVSAAADGQCTIWSSSQGQFMVRAYCAKLLGIDISDIRAIPADLEENGPAGQDGDEPRGSLPRHRTRGGCGSRSQARRQEGRPPQRRRGRAQIPGRRLPGLAGRAGLHVRLCDV